MGTRRTILSLSGRTNFKAAGETCFLPARAVEDEGLRAADERLPEFDRFAYAGKKVFDVEI